MIDKKIIGFTFPRHSIAVEAGQLRFFAKSIGETDPVYFDESAARDRGHPNLPVPPTFLFSLELARPANDWRDKAGMLLERILHGEQSFKYHRMAYAGDVLHFDSEITDLYDKKGGALQFLVTDVKVTNQRGEHVADLRKVLAYRNG